MNQVIKKGSGVFSRIAETITYDSLIVAFFLFKDVGIYLEYGLSKLNVIPSYEGLWHQSAMGM